GPSATCRPCAEGSGAGCRSDSHQSACEDSCVPAWVLRTALSSFTHTGQGCQEGSGMRCPPWVASGDWTRRASEEFREKRKPGSPVETASGRECEQLYSYLPDRSKRSR